MSKRGVIVVVLLVVSEVLGVLLGEFGFRLFQQTLPKAVVSDFSVTAAHGAFVFWGVVVGLGLFAWSLVAALLGRFAFTPGAAPAATSTPAPKA